MPSTRASPIAGGCRSQSQSLCPDSLGVGIAGSSVEGGGALARCLRRGRPAGAGVGPRSARLSAPAAAFLNAWQMHNQNATACTRRGRPRHGDDLPAALAAAEMRGGVSGAELIAAVAVGVDIAAGLGLASQAGFRFFRPGTAGGFGAVAAAARVLGLDKGLEAAFAWQLAQASGTMQAHAEGSPILPAQLAFNARAAVQSCELATLGFVPAARCSRGRTDTGPVRGRLRTGAGPGEPRPRLANYRIQPQAISGRSRHPWRHRRRHGAQTQHRFEGRRRRLSRDQCAAPDRAPGRPATAAQPRRELCAAVHGLGGGESSQERRARSGGFSRRCADRSRNARAGATRRTKNDEAIPTPTRSRHRAWS